ncbi:MAG: ATP-binding protein [Myxococcota bacterium]
MATAHGDRDSRIRLLTIFAATLASALCVLVVSDSARLVGDTFPGFLVWDNGTLVALHTEGWSGVQAGLPLNGGRVVEVDGEAFAGGAALLDRARSLEPGQSIEYRVRSGEGEAHYEVPVIAMSWPDWFATFGNYVLNAICFFAIALIALYLRPDLRAARALAVSMSLFGLLMILAVDFVSTYRFLLFTQLVEALTPAAFGILGLVFPVERLRGGRFRLAAAGLIGVGVVLGIANAGWFRTNPELARTLTSTAYLAIAVVALAMLASFAHALRLADEVSQRVQAAVVFAGGLVAFLFPSLAVLAFFPLGWSFSFTWITTLLLFFPLSILYAIVRYDLLGAERFIRTTLGYAVATSTVMVTYAILALALDRFVAPEASRSPAASFGLLLAIAILFDPIRRRVQRTVDRQFYRTVVDSGRVLEESGADFASLLDEDAVVERAKERVSSALGLEWADFSTDGAPSSGTAHAEPVVFRGQRLGTLSSGPKRSGAPMSEAERELVRGLASQLALAIHNARAIEALRRAQATVLRTERLAVVGEFAGAVAHGVRNPLSGIRASAQMARDEADPIALRDALDGVISEADRLEQRVRSLLDFSRPTEPRHQPVELGPLLAAVAQTIGSSAHGAGVSVRVEHDPEAAEISTDPDYLEEALLELAGNAVRATPAGGTLVISSRAISGAIELRVTDTGAGIPEAVRERIFDLFFTTRREGTGMGLAYVRKTIEQLGGEIALESTGPGRTTFRIALAT